MNEQILTSEQVCELLQIGRQSLRKLRRNGEFPYFCVGGSLRYNRRDVLDWAFSQTREKNGGENDGENN